MLLMTTAASRILCRCTAQRSFSLSRWALQEAEKLQRPPEAAASSPPDDRPLLFVQKYACMVDVDALKLPDPPPELSTPSNQLQRKIRLVQEAVASTDDLESLARRLRTAEMKRISSPIPSSTIGENAFVDEDIVLNSRLTSGGTREINLGAEQEHEEEEEVLKWTDTRLDASKLPGYYLSLSKARLTMLVCTTTAAGYGLGPGSFDPATFLFTVLGTGLLSASANAVNQYLEVPFDSQMNRTKNRVLVRGLLSPLHVVAFSAVVGSAGTILLASQVNMTAAALGVSNLILYTCVYTPLKRVSMLNTWVGSVVGAIPPLIGWAGAAGGILDPGALVLAGLLYSWQFPHFNSLSWNLRPDYSRAGYRMMSVTSPALCRRVALRHSLVCQALCFAAPVLDLTEAHFALEALPVNAVLIYLAWEFHRKGDSSSSRKLFRYSLIHLPLLMTLLFVSKKKRNKAPS